MPGGRADGERERSWAMIELCRTGKMDRKTTLACLGLLALATGAFFLPVILQGRTLIGHDMTLWGIPTVHYIHQMAGAGKFFAWNPHIYTGLPTVASSMGITFYPLNIFFLLFDPLKHTFYYFLLHQAMAGMLAFLYLKRHRFSPLACLTGALLFAFSATRLHFFINIEYYGILTFSPLILMAIDSLVERPGFRTVAGLSLAVSLAVLCGGLHFLLIYTAFFLGYGLFMAWRAQKTASGGLWASVAASLVLITGIAAVLILPLGVEFMGEGPSRQQSLPYWLATDHSIGPATLPMAVFDNFSGDAKHLLDRNVTPPHEHTYFMGFLGILLLLLALTFARKKRKHLLYFLVGAAAVGLFLGLGGNNPLYPLLYKTVPFFRLFRRPSRFLVILPVLTLYASACGVEILSLFARRKDLIPARLRSRLSSLLKGFLIFALAFYAAFLAWGNRQCLFDHAVLAASIATAAALGFLALQGRRPGLAAGALCLSVLLTMMSPFNFIDRHLLDRPGFLQDEMRFLDGIKAGLPAPHYKVLYTINPNMTQIKALSNTAGTIPLNFRRYQDYLYAAFNGKFMTGEEFQRLTSFNSHPLMFISGAPSFHQAISGPYDWGTLYRERMKDRPMYRMLCPAVTILPGGYYIERNPLPRFYFSRGYRVVADQKKILEELMEPGFDPLGRVIIDTPPSGEWEGFSLGAAPPPPGKAAITHFEPDVVKISLNGEGGWLTLSDAWYPGWEAWVDGAPRAIFRGNYMFRTVPVKPGEREIVFRYRSPALEKGTRITAATLTVILILYGLSLIPGKPDRGGTTPGLSRCEAPTQESRG